MVKFHPPQKQINEEVVGRTTPAVSPAWLGATEIWPHPFWSKH